MRLVGSRESVDSDTGAEISEEHWVDGEKAIVCRHARRASKGVRSTVETWTEYAPGHWRYAAWTTGGAVRGTSVEEV